MNIKRSVVLQSKIQTVFDGSLRNDMYYTYVFA